MARQEGRLELALVVQAVDQGSRNDHLDPAGVEPVGIHSVVLEVLGRNIQCIALHPGVDVLGDEDRVSTGFVEFVGDAEDPVVGDVQIQREGSGPIATMDPDRASLVVPFDSLEESSPRTEVVQIPDDLT